MLLLFFALKFMGLLRATADEEALGLDSSHHGGSAYAGTPDDDTSKHTTNTNGVSKVRAPAHACLLLPVVAAGRRPCMHARQEGGCLHARARACGMPLLRRQGEQGLQACMRAGREGCRLHAWGVRAAWVAACDPLRPVPAQSEFEYLKSEINQLKASIGKNQAVDKV